MDDVHEDIRHVLDNLHQYNLSDLKDLANDVLIYLNCKGYEISLSASGEVEAVKTDYL